MGEQEKVEKAGLVFPCFLNRRVLPMKALLHCFTAGVIVCTVLRSEHVKTRKRRIRRNKMSKQSDKFQVSKGFLCSFVFFWCVLVTLYGGVMGLDPSLGTFPRAFGATENVVYDFDVTVLFRSAIWDRSVHRKNQNKNDTFFILFPSIPSGALSRLALFHATGNFRAHSRATCIRARQQRDKANPSAFWIILDRGISKYSFTDPGMVLVCWQNELDSNLYTCHEPWSWSMAGVSLPVL